MSTTKIEQEKAEKSTKQSRLRVPHTFIILTFVVALMAILTHIIPSGMYNRVTNSLGVEVLDSSSFHFIESTPVSALQFLTSIPRGFVEAGWIIAMVFFVGAAFEIVSRIGLIPALVNSLATRFSKRKVLIIPVLILIFATIDAFIGTPELIVVYVPIVLPLMLRLGFDSITGVAVVLCGSAAGFSAGITNPFTITIAQKLSDLPLYSGWEYRIVMFFITWIIATVYVMFYALRVLKNPQKSPTYAGDIEKRERAHAEAELNNQGTGLNLRQKIAGVFTVAVFALMVFGMVSWNWDLPEMCAAFLLIGVGAALIAGMDSYEMCEHMMFGAQAMMVGALVIAISSAIAVVMTDGQIVDTVVNWMATVLNQMPSGVTILGVLVAVSLLNFLIPSGSGKAVVLMPILAPLADAIGVTRQTMVTAFQLGDGFTLYLWPTVGFFMAALVLGGVSYMKWVRFFLPLSLIFMVAGAGYLLFAQAIQYGPF